MNINRLNRLSRSPLLLSSRRAFSQKPSNEDNKKSDFFQKKKDDWDRELNQYKNIIKPVRPYNFKEYKYREVDPTLSRTQQILKRSKYILQDSYGFLLDFWRGDYNAVMFKTAYSMRR